MISVKLFGIAKEIVGSNTLNIEQELGTVDDLLTYLKSKYPRFKDLTSLLVAINDEYANATDRIKSEDEVALIPPVSGG